MEKLVNITNSVWDGSSKLFTKLCTGCEFYRKSYENRCYWGIAYKVLDKSKTLSYCQLINKESPRKRLLHKLK